MTADEVAAAVAQAFAAAVSEAVSSRGRFLCAVPGGSVAERVLPRLAGLRVDWSSVHVWLADERMVDADDAGSNQRAVRTGWIDRLGPSRPTFHVPQTTQTTAEEAAAKYADGLAAVAGVPPRLDVVLLGVGADGHVASLFPAEPGWRTDGRWAIGVHGAPKPPPDRVSLGLATLAGAAEIWLVAFGAEKAAAIARARRDPASSLPAAVVARSGPSVRWFLDRDATGS